MTGIFQKSIKTKRATIEMHRLLQCAWENTKFSGRQIFEISYNFQQQMPLQSGKKLNYEFSKYPPWAAIIWHTLWMKWEETHINVSGGMASHAEQIHCSSCSFLDCDNTPGHSSVPTEWNHRDSCFTNKEANPKCFMYVWDYPKQSHDLWNVGSGN